MDVSRIKDWSKVYIGKPCKNCGNFLRYRSNRNCVSCKFDYLKEWREANRERMRETKRKWRDANRERVREYDRKHYEANREKHRENSRRHYEANREKQREKSRKYYEANRQRVSERYRKYREANLEYLTEKDRKWREANRERMRETKRKYRNANLERERERTRMWHRANPEKLIVYNRNRRARKLLAPGTHTAADIRAIKVKQKHCCYYCGKHESEFDNKWHVDHITPLSRGGSNDPANLICACESCNGSKHNKKLFRVGRVSEESERLANDRRCDMKKNNEQ